MRTSRLYFIDIVRAFAILMMLQGHFIDTLIDPVYRDTSFTSYKIWSYFRGITAPTFFTISGLIFTYLLLRAKDKGEEKKRMRKGITRGLFLIGVGYLLRIPFLAWLTGHFNYYFLAIDVLQIIGLSLILIISIYFFTFKKTYLFSFLTLICGLLIFVCEPLYRGISIESLPIFLSNYISKANGSVFTVIPWFGFVSFGAFIATIFYKNLHKIYFKYIVITVFTVLGISLIEYSSLFLVYLSKTFNIQLFMDSASYNYLFTRLGNVLLYFVFFYALENYLKIPIILKIGQKTLSIYVIHFIIIYGSFTGFGLKHIFGKSLNPIEAIFGAALFLVVVCFISFYYAKTNTFLYVQRRKLIEKRKLKNS